MSFFLIRSGTIIVIIPCIIRQIFSLIADLDQFMDGTFIGCFYLGTIINICGKTADKGV